MILEGDEYYFENYSQLEASEKSIISQKPLDAGFFIPAHPVWLIVPYALYLTFASFLCPITCLPSFLPLAPLLTSLGTSYPVMMGSFSALFGAIHMGEALQAWHLAREVYNLNPVTSGLWSVTGFFFGLVGFWPLAFPDVFLRMSDSYCTMPGVWCLNVNKSDLPAGWKDLRYHYYVSR